MDPVEKVRMRMHPVLALATVGAMLVACDDASAPIVASFGGVQFPGAPGLNIVLSPSLATLRVGQSLQLFVNLPDTMRSQVLWRSLEPRIAVVTQDGFVTAVAAGQATILARLASDTNRVAPATIVVPGVIVIPGVVVAP
jgi:Bacterial Ig-like domain (group 2)